MFSWIKIWLCNSPIKKYWEKKAIRLFFRSSAGHNCNKKVRNSCPPRILSCYENVAFFGVTHAGTLLRMWPSRGHFWHNRGHFFQNRRHFEKIRGHFRNKSGTLLIFTRFLKTFSFHGFYVKQIRFREGQLIRTNFQRFIGHHASEELLWTTSELFCVKIFFLQSRFKENSWKAHLSGEIKLIWQVILEHIKRVITRGACALQSRRMGWENQASLE